MKNIYILSEFSALIQTPFDLCLALVGETFPDSFKELLGPLEKTEGGLRRSPIAHRQWLTGRLAAKSAAAHKWGLPPELVETTSGPGGEPRLHLPGREPGRTGVSISHTKGAAAAAVACSPLGLDLERLDRNISDRVWQWAFSPDEQRLAAGESSGPWPARLSFWCAREAASKYWQRPLLNNLGQIRVSGADWGGGRIKVSWLGSEPRSIEVHLLEHQVWLLALACEFT